MNFIYSSSKKTVFTTVYLLGKVIRDKAICSKGLYPVSVLIQPFCLDPNVIVFFSAYDYMYICIVFLYFDFGHMPENADFNGGAVRQL